MDLLAVGSHFVWCILYYMHCVVVWIYAQQLWWQKEPLTLEVVDIIFINFSVCSDLLLRTICNVPILFVCLFSCSFARRNVISYDFFNWFPICLIYVSFYIDCFAFCHFPYMPKGACVLPVYICCDCCSHWLCNIPTSWSYVSERISFMWIDLDVRSLSAASGFFQHDFQSW